MRGHWLPLDPDQMLEISKKIFQKEKCTNVFLVTRDLNYYDKLIPDSDDSIEWGNIWLRIHRYLELNFQDEIKVWYIQNCG